MPWSDERCRLCTHDAPYNSPEASGLADRRAWTPGLCFRFHCFAIRKLHFLLRARALVVFPGGFGTMDEFFETLTLIQTRKIGPLPVVLVGEAFWRRAFDPDFLVDEGVIDPEDRDLFWYAETAEEIWKDIVRWYARAGRPLLR